MNKVYFQFVSNLNNGTQTVLSFLFLFFSIVHISAQNCLPETMRVDTIKASDTDDSIFEEQDDHLVFNNPQCPENGKLLVHLVGTIDNPASTTFYPSLAANNGYKVINLKYRNNISASNTCKSNSDPDCYRDFHQEIIYGQPVSPDVFVNESNSILNRLIKLVIYLDNLYPSEGWGEFLIDQENVAWHKLVLSGHSQGGGHAAFMAKDNQVDRVIMFASPNEYSDFFNAPTEWLSESGATPDSCFYAFLNLKDEIVDFGEQYSCVESMNITTWGDSLIVDNEICPFDNSRIPYIDYEGFGILGPNHNAVVIDNFLPLDGEVPKYLETWRYLLDLCPISSSVLETESSSSKLEVFPNPVDGLLQVKSAHQIIEVKIIDQRGVVLKSLYPFSNVFEIDCQSHRGLLYLRFITDDHEQGVLKILVN